MSSDCVFPPRLPSPTEGRQLDPDAQTSTLHHRMPSDAQDAGAFFTGSQNFAISGGSFTSHVHQTLPREVPLDFRTIPLGDIDLQEDLHPDHIDEYRGYLHRRRRRRMYSAKVNGREMTVVMSQADEREKENWVNEVKRINSLRHPSLLQLYGIASSGRTCAAIYHGGVVSMEHLLHHLRADPERRVKLRLKVSCEFGAALNVLNSIGAPFSWSTLH
ncbi:hypothetical protein C8F01DRAFT_768340 [Mycena amicta]|nr:hypothetical protein C8F01DRAFT_768340 [Mycena amicta]